MFEGGNQGVSAGTVSMTAPAGTVADFLARAVATSPDREAVIDRFGRLTYGQLADQVGRAAAGLQRLGIGQGDIVVVQLPNWHHFFVVHLALTHLGAVTAPLAPMYRQREVAEVVRATSAKLIVIAAEFRGFDYPAMVRLIRPDLPALRHVVVVGAGSTDDTIGYEDLVALNHGDEVPPRAAVDPEAVTVIMFTSGTTGQAKGVMHHSANLAKINAAFAEWFELGSSDVVYMPTPITHASGLFHGVRLPLFLGVKVVLDDRWEPATGMRLIHDEGCTITCVPPAIVEDIVASPLLDELDRLPTLRYIIIPSSNAERLRTAQAALPHTCVASCYAGTDFGFVTCGRAVDPVAKRLSTDGRPLGPVEIRIDAGETVDGAQGSGEILTRGFNCAGYHGRPDLSASAVTNDGFFRTGDLGFLDADGYLTVTGRLKEIIRRAGVNIAPAEVETVLAGHPKIAQIAVVGLPDKRLEEIVCACVVPADAADPVTIEDIVAWMAQSGLARQKWPQRVENFDAFPLSVYARVQKFALRERILAAQAAP